MLWINIWFIFDSVTQVPTVQVLIIAWHKEHWKKMQRRQLTVAFQIESLSNA